MFKYIAITTVFLSVMIPKQTKALRPVTEVGGNLFTNIANTVESVWNTGVVKALEPAMESVANRLLDKVINDSLNWAFDGFNDEPGFVNNFGDFVKDTKYDEIIDWYDQSSGIISQAAQTGWNSGSATPATPGQVAEQNYQNQNSENYKLKRAATKAIALYGKENLGKSKLAKTINLENETLSGLLGGQGGVQNFKSDFKKGGWGAYLELLNPSNTQIGVTSLVKSQIDEETNKKIEQTVTDLQTPLKFLNKTECLEYKTNETTGKQVCVQERTVTPGDQVAEKVNKAIVKDENTAENADGLIATLLKSAVGKITAGVVDRGLSKITSAATGAFYNASQDIFNNGSIDAQFGFDPTGTNDGFNDNSTPSLNFNVGGANSMYIGGPEDQAGYGQGGAELIIDLQAELEQMMDYAAKEKEYFDKIRLVKKENEGTIIGLDKCIPGPDAGWEDRFRDLGSESSNQQLQLLALTTTKEMFEDPKTNIPGASDMLAAVNTILGGINQDDAQNQQRIQALAKIISTLNYVHDEVLAGFNTAKQDNNPNLVIFSDDWEELTTAQKESAFTYALNNQFATLLPGETAASVVANNPEKARKAVIEAGWKIWVTETAAQEKSDLRYSYYIIQNDLANEETIARARADATRIENNAVRSKSLLRDCIVLKAYSLGVSEPSIQNILNQGNANSLTQMTAQINQFSSPSVLGSFLGGLGGTGSSSSSSPVFINVPNAKSDAAIKSFLLDQRLKQQNNEPSLFLTTVITSGVSNSILGFETAAEKNDYFDTLYPDANLSKSYVKNAKTMLAIYTADTFIYLKKEVGVLFCRHPGIGQIHPFFSPESSCLLPWYKASKLDYATAFLGI